MQCISMSWTPHNIDDDESYKIRGLAAHSEQDLLEEARGYICYHDNVREYSSFGYRTLFAYLKQQ